MTLTKEQISQLKKQLFEQVKNLPKEQKEDAEKQIEELSDEAMEEMLESQKQAKVDVFREIVSGKIPSSKIGESKEAIAVLDIKPLSSGHTIIIPKERAENESKLPKEIANFIKEISEKLIKKLNPKKIKSVPEIKFGEVIINLIPIYDKEISLDSERLSQSDDQINNIYEKISKKDEIIEKEEAKEKEPVKKLRRRIP